MTITTADHTPASVDDAESGVGRGVVVGSVVGVVLSFVAIGAAMLLGGKGLGAATGLAVFVALWGGLGFGSMIGGVLGVIRLDEAEADARGDHRHDG